MTDHMNSYRSDQEQKILEQINRIFLLRIKTLIVRNLKKEDIPAFREIVLQQNSNALFQFAIKKIPELENKLLEEFTAVNQELKERVKKYAPS